MTYTVTDLTELVCHHLYLTEPTEAAGAAKVHELVRNLHDLIGYVPRPTEWLICDGCGCSVDTDLITTDGPDFTPDGDFYCSDCWPTRYVEASQ